MSGVLYNSYHVSDEGVRQMLENISPVTGLTVYVVSGDRNFVPKGGAKKSDHLTGRAADFHLNGLSDEHAFALIRSKWIEIFGDHMEYQVIFHGSNTKTEGEHIHLGHPTDKGRFGFWKENSGGNPLYSPIK